MCNMSNLKISNNLALWRRFNPFVTLHWRIQFLSFSCIFLHKPCRIIGFRLKLQGCPPALEILVSPLHFQIGPQMMTKWHQFYHTTVNCKIKKLKCALRHSNVSSTNNHIINTPPPPPQCRPVTTCKTSFYSLNYGVVDKETKENSLSYISYVGRNKGE